MLTTVWLVRLHKEAVIKVTVMAMLKHQLVRVIIEDEVEAMTLFLEGEGREGGTFLRCFHPVEEPLIILLTQSLPEQR